LDFISNDKKAIEEMLQQIGVNSFKDLYTDIPNSLLIENLNLPDGISEADLLKELNNLALKNHVYKTSFLGAGSYYHYLPSLIDYVISRSEFFTAYTPYQAEASQGMLQAIFEFQSVVSRITKMDVSNASMYDLASAMAEAATLCSFTTRKKKILLLEGIHPEYIETVKTYCWGRGIDVEISTKDEMKSKINDEYGGIIFQNPDFFGELHNIEEITRIVREKTKKCKIVYAMPDPSALGILKAPGDYDIDIFVAEGIGLTPSFGGPNLGIFAASKQLMRKMPGRIIGLTKDINGDKDGFILTLQAREQHIRREKALSNICTNQALCMLACLIYFICMGKTGLKQIAYQNIQKANYLMLKLQKEGNVEIISKNPIYNEFVAKISNENEFLKKIKENDILGPLRLSNYFSKRDNQYLFCVTEMNSKEDIELLIKCVQSSRDNSKLGDNNYE